MNKRAALFVPITSPERVCDLERMRDQKTLRPAPEGRRSMFGVTVEMWINGDDRPVARVSVSDVALWFSVF